MGNGGRVMFDDATWTAAAGPALAVLALAATAGGFAATRPPRRWKPTGNAVWRQGEGRLAGAPALVTSSRVDPAADYGLSAGGARLLSPPVRFGRISPDPGRTSLWFKPTVSGPNGGSPRFAFRFDNGFTAYAYPAADFVAGSWQQLTLEDATWELYNDAGDAVAFYTGDYTQVVDAVAGLPATVVTHIYVTNDSGWAYPAGGEQVYLSHVLVNGVLAAPN